MHGVARAAHASGGGADGKRVQSADPRLRETVSKVRSMLVTGERLVTVWSVSALVKRRDYGP